MKTDAEIEAERSYLERYIGPTRAGWYAEACKVEGDGPEQLWACRFREMAHENAWLESLLASLEDRS